MGNNWLFNNLYVVIHIHTHTHIYAHIHTHTHTHTHTYIHTHTHTHKHTHTPTNRHTHTHTQEFRFSLRTKVNKKCDRIKSVLSTVAVSNHTKAGGPAADPMFSWPKVNYKNSSLRTWIGVSEECVKTKSLIYVTVVVSIQQKLKGEAWNFDTNFMTTLKHGVPDTIQTRLHNLRSGLRLLILPTTPVKNFSNSYCDFVHWSFDFLFIF